MSALRIHVSVQLLLCGLCGTAAYALGGTAWLFPVCFAYTACWLAYHLRRLAALERCLAQPLHKQPESESGGWWGQLFATIERQQHLQHKQRRRLRQTLIRFQAAAEALPDGIIITNQDGRIEWLNHQAVRQLNLSPQHALGGQLRKQIEQAAFQQFFKQPLTDILQTLHLILPQPNGINRHLKLVRIPLHRRSELVISEDITRAEQLNATRAAFVANVSHELRTPLTVIGGFLETLADHPGLPDGQRQQFVALMRQESDRMLQLVSDLLTLSALEDPGHPAAREDIDLSKLAHELTEAACRLSAGRHVIRSRITGHIHLCGNRSELYQALSNLVFNAVRHTPPGGEIDISLTPADNPNPYKPPLARFAVRDNGPGIAAEHLPHLTDRFYRVDKARSRASGGTGLGLAITKHALANHNAVLDIRSEVGQGSEFAVSLQTSAPLPEETGGNRFDDSANSTE